jgi:hypothetical protein
VEAFLLSQLDVLARNPISFDLAILKPDEVGRIAAHGIGRMLLLVVHDPRAVFATPEHRMRPPREPVALNDVVRDEKVLVGSGYDPNIHTRDIVKDVHLGV